MTDLKRLMKEGSNVQILDKAYPQRQLEEIAKKAREYNVNLSIKVSSLKVEEMKSISKKGGHGVSFLFDDLQEKIYRSLKKLKP